MIKGVNKRIVEINNPENEFFEKAILYIRPNKQDIPPAMLSSEAKEYLGNLKGNSPAPKKTNLPLLLGASGGILTLLLVLLLLL